MRAVVQRVLGASVAVAGNTLGGFDSPGLLVHPGVTHDDGRRQVEGMANG